MSSWFCCSDGSDYVETWSSIWSFTYRCLRNASTVQYGRFLATTGFFFIITRLVVCEIEWWYWRWIEWSSIFTKQSRLWVCVHPWMLLMYLGRVHFVEDYQIFELIQLIDIMLWLFIGSVFFDLIQLSYYWNSSTEIQHMIHANNKEKSSSSLVVHCRVKFKLTILKSVNVDIHVVVFVKEATYDLDVSVGYLNKSNTHWIHARSHSLCLTQRIDKDLPLPQTLRVWTNSWPHKSQVKFQYSFDIYWIGQAISEYILVVSSMVASAAADTKRNGMKLMLKDISQPIISAQPQRMKQPVQASFHRTRILNCQTSLWFFLDVGDVAIEIERKFSEIDWIAQIGFAHSSDSCLFGRLFRTWVILGANPVHV